MCPLSWRWVGAEVPKVASRAGLLVTASGPVGNNLAMSRLCVYATLNALNDSIELIDGGNLCLRVDRYDSNSSRKAKV